MTTPPSPLPDPPPSSDSPIGPGIFSAYRETAALILSLTFVQASISCLTLIIMLHLRDMGASSLELGLVGSSFAAGLCLGAMSAPREIRRIGHIRSYVFFAAAAMIAIFAFNMAANILIWALIQIVVGACFSGLWAAGEGWVARAAPDDRRGALISFYHLVNKLGAISGPFLAAALVDKSDGFVLAAALLAAAILPIAGTGRPQPETGSAHPLNPVQIFKLAPAAAWAAFTAGLVNTAVGQLYPIYVHSLGTDAPVTLAAQFNAALLAGVMVALWPAGYISDRMDRRLVIAGAGAVGALGAFLLAAFGRMLSEQAFFGVVMIYGAGALCHYAIAVAHATDKADPSDATSVVAGLLLVWSAGSVVGPLFAGAIMSTGLGPSGLFVFAGFGLVCMTAAMMFRASSQDAVASDDKEPFVPAQTTSLAFAQLDPRGEDDQLELFDWNNPAD